MGGGVSAKLPNVLLNYKVDNDMFVHSPKPLFLRKDKGAYFDINFGKVYSACLNFFNLINKNSSSSTFDNTYNSNHNSSRVYILLIPRDHCYPILVRNSEQDHYVNVIYKFP